MPQFSSRSEAHLETCHPELQRLFNTVVESHDCMVIEGYRGRLDQDKYYRAGTTKLQWPHGAHNKRPSLAVDVAPRINGATTFDDHACRHFAGFVMGIATQLGIKIRWGGDWDGDRDQHDQKFDDLVHFELVV